MLKLAARTFDIYDDLEDLTIAKKVAAKLGPVTVAEPDEVEALQDHQFGLLLKTASGAVLRRYPLHTPDAVKLSRAYFAEAQLPKAISEQVEMKIAAAETGNAEINACVAYLDATKLSEDKVAAWDAKEEAWGLTIGDRNYFPLHTEDLVKTAESRFVSTAAGLEPHERFVYANAIAKQADKLGVKLASSSHIHNYTNEGVNHGALKTAIDERKRILKSAGLNTLILDQLAIAAGCDLERGDIEDDDVFAHRAIKHAQAKRIDGDAAVQILAGVDKYAGITDRMYLRGLPDPYASCYKRAEAQAATFIDGVDLTSIPPQKLQEAFDDAFVAEFQKDPVAVYHSLPDPMKTMIRDLACSKNDVCHSGEAAEKLKPGYSNGAASGLSDSAHDNVQGGGGDAQANLSPMYSNAGSGLNY